MSRHAAPDLLICSTNPPAVVAIDSPRFCAPEGRTAREGELLARHVTLERQDPAIIDDRGVEALPLSAHINADP